MPDITKPSDDRPTSKRALGGVIALVVAAAAVIAYFSMGMPGMDHGSAAQPHDMASMSTSSPNPTRLRELTANEFSDALADGTAVVINVHTPDEGTIAGTELAIAYDKISASAELPTRLDQPILLYCMTGRMSKIAGQTLTSMGYTNVSHLLGGMNSWTSSGFTLLDGS